MLWIILSLWLKKIIWTDRSVWSPPLNRWHYLYIGLCYEQGQIYLDLPGCFGKFSYIYIRRKHVQYIQPFWRQTCVYDPRTIISNEETCFQDFLVILTRRLHIYICICTYVCMCVYVCLYNIQSLISMLPVGKNINK